jgi:methylmalonyl-CoA mutase
VKVALEALTRAASGRENLLGLALEAARARASVGEISGALEAVWGRHAGDTGNIVGAYGKYYENDAAWQALRARISKFEQLTGRRPRILVAKLGQDGHDRGARLIASGFADAGFDVDVGPLFQTPDEVAQQAIENDVHVVGVSTQAGGHLTLLPELVVRLRTLGAGDVVTVCGGIIPDADHAALAAAGVALVFGPGTTLVDAIGRVLDCIWPEPGASGGAA